jgi:hypothetical protein
MAAPIRVVRPLANVLTQAIGNATGRRGTK